ncbi:type VII toxin-antitoxin system HepT family RNase toxin [Marinoscillum sp.]|uniref:type VII toxin-antitoxin system HepT family RNase toxin n=1 Tax=Marinoscillum sp. TaxID=2024838 RepID=UPI003BAD1BD3
MDEVISGKVATIESCLVWIKKQNQSAEWKEDQLVKRELLLNLEKACQASIDCSAKIIEQRSFTVPKLPRESFSMLESIGVVSGDTVNSLKKMLAMRGLISHDENIKSTMLESIIINEISCLEDFCKSVKRI